MSEEFLTTKEAAAFLKLAPQTLNNWRNLGNGPKFRKFGRRVVYARSELMAWADQGAAQNTQAAR
jgi:predicted DNA-binding transcriptional regulator AlpA